MSFRLHIFFLYSVCLPLLVYVKYCNVKELQLLISATVDLRVVMCASCKHCMSV